MSVNAERKRRRGGRKRDTKEGEGKRKGRKRAEEVLETERGEGRRETDTGG